MYNYNAKSYALIEKEYLEQFNEQQRVYYKLLLSKEDETRKFRHDISNELAYIKNLLLSNNYADALHIINEMNEDISVLKRKDFSIGNETMDIMLNYLLVPVKEQCSVSVSGVIGSDINISPRDICIIISNLLTNAIEEVMSADNKKKMIKVVASRGRHSMRLIVENSISHIVNIDKKIGFPATTKTDKNIHGLGLKNVKKIVDNNGGLFELECKNDIFKAEIILKI